MTKEAMTEWFCYYKMLCQYFSVLLTHNTHRVKCYHFFIVEVGIVKSVNLKQTSQRKIIITMMENKYFFKKSTYQNTEQNERCSYNFYFIAL